MDIGRLLIFIPVAIYCFYFFRKTKLNVYLMFGTLTWYGAIYSGKHNLYQLLQEPIKTIVNVITMLLVFRIFIPVFILYLKSSFEEYKRYKESLKA